jgi:copper chaperone CopZ
MTQKTGLKKKRRRISGATVILIVGICVLLIPIFGFGYLLYTATLGSGTPLFGNRFTNDLNPAITKAQLTTIETSIKGLAGVESSAVNLKSATLRITVDTVDTLDAAAVKALATKLYTTIETTVPAATYFTADETKKMYDMELSVYNLKDGKDKPNYFYFIIVKNSNMKTWKIQEISVPLDAALAQQLRDAVKPPVAATTGSTLQPSTTIRMQEGNQPSFRL